MLVGFFMKFEAFGKQPAARANMTKTLSQPLIPCQIKNQQNEN